MEAHLYFENKQDYALNLWDQKEILKLLKYSDTNNVDLDQQQLNHNMDFLYSTTNLQLNQKLLHEWIYSKQEHICYLKDGKQ